MEKDGKLEVLSTLIALDKITIAHFFVQGDLFLISAMIFSS